MKLLDVGYKSGCLIFRFDGDSVDVVFNVFFSDDSFITLKKNVSSTGVVELDVDRFGMAVKRVRLSDEILISERDESFLCNISPLNNKEYESQFIRKIQRFPKIDIQFFISDQIYNFFQGDLAYKLSAVVVMAYKAVEINDQFSLDRAWGAIEFALENVNQCSVEWHPRRNGEHLKFSLLCAAYHVALSRNDKKGFEKILYEVECSHKNISNFFTPAYPICLSLLMKVIVCFVEGKDDLELKVKDIEAVFKRAVEDSKIEKLTLFEELKITHDSCVLAKKITQNKVSISDAFSHAVRVKGKAKDNLLTNFHMMFNIKS